MNGLSENTCEVPLDLDADLMKSMYEEEIAILQKANNSLVKFVQTTMSLSRKDLKRWYSSEKMLVPTRSYRKDIKMLNDAHVTLADITACADTICRRMQMSSDFDRLVKHIDTDDSMRSIWDQLLMMMRLLEGSDDE